MATYANYYYHHKGGGTHSSEFYKAAAERYYQNAMDNAASYNSSIRADRKFRLPFLDSQTGVAQNHSNLWTEQRFRSKGSLGGRIYTYPAKRWRTKRRPFPAYDLNAPKTNDVETGDADLHQISTIENPAAKAAESQSEFPRLEQALTDSPQVSTSKYEYYDEWDNGSEPPDAGEIDDRNSDSSDFEETYIKKRKKKSSKKGTGRGRKSAAKEDKVDEIEKPYSCELCGARYKTRPGLSYHLSHFHHKMEEDEEEVVAASPAHPQSTNGKTSKSNGNNPNSYCDFCLGDEENNKKTGSKEELVSCSDCGRSGHPTCLQFTENMIISVKKYPWQCIECKSCGLCGTSDNDDQLLFCDDCDRGYHMYCLNPPLSAPPEGSWSCHLCIVEFYGGKNPCEPGAAAAAASNIPPEQQQQQQEQEQQPPQLEQQQPRPQIPPPQLQPQQ